MVTTGYSGTPLIKKLGIKENMRVMLIHAPENYFGLLEKNITGQLWKKNDKPAFIHLFVKTKKEFEIEMKKLKSIKPTTSIWISWYKKSAGIPTEINEDVIR